MIKSFLVFVLCFFSLYIYAQSCVVANAKMNVVYVGVPNPLNVAVEGYRCEDLKVTTDNGVITLSEGGCSYSWEGTKAGRTAITLADRKTGTKLGVVEFSVKYVPDPVAMVAGKQGGVIAKEVLVAQIGVIASHLCYDFDARFVVTRFSISVIRKGSTVFVEETTGAKFSKQTKQAFDGLRNGDKILITNIRAVGPDRRTRVLRPIEFIISE